MRKLLAVALPAILLVGCTSSVSMKMGDHLVYARKSLNDSPTIAGNDYMSVVTINGKMLTITLGQATWASGKAVALPEGWKKLEVKEVDSRLVVVVDGQTLDEPARRF